MLHLASKLFQLCLLVIHPTSFFLRQIESTVRQTVHRASDYGASNEQVAHLLKSFQKPCSSIATKFKECRPTLLAEQPTFECVCSKVSTHAPEIHANLQVLFRDLCCQDSSVSAKQEQESHRLFASFSTLELSQMRGFRAVFCNPSRTTSKARIELSVVRASRLVFCKDPLSPKPQNLD